MNKNKNIEKLKKYKMTDEQKQKKEKLENIIR